MNISEEDKINVEHCLNMFMLPTSSKLLTFWRHACEHNEDLEKPSKERFHIEKTICVSLAFVCIHISANKMTHFREAKFCRACKHGGIGAFTKEHLTKMNSTGDSNFNSHWMQKPPQIRWKTIDKRWQLINIWQHTSASNTCHACMAKHASKQSMRSRTNIAQSESNEWRKVKLLAKSSLTIFKHQNMQLKRFMCAQQSEQIKNKRTLKKRRQKQFTLVLSLIHCQCESQIQHQMTLDHNLYIASVIWHCFQTLWNCVLWFWTFMPNSKEWLICSKLLELFPRQSALETIGK